MLALGTQAPDFSLPNPAGKISSRTDFVNKPLLVFFTCNHCPFVKHIRVRLAEVTSGFISKGVAVVGINSNDVERYPDDSPEMMAREAEKFGFEFPYLFDASQEIAHAYQAACTPDFFLFDAEHRLVYRGQFDGSRPGGKSPVTGEDLSRAVEAVISGVSPMHEQIPSIGCGIKWKPGNEPGYLS
jgi:peroxiredoxin